MSRVTLRLDTAVRRKILVLDHTAALGGAEIALVRLLAAIDEERYTASVLLFGDGPLREQLHNSGVDVDVLPISEGLAARGRNALLTGPINAAQTGISSLRFAKRLARAILSSGADLVVANSLKSAVLGAVASRKAHRPWVWHLHDRLSTDYLPGSAAAALRAMARHSPRQVVVNSEETGSHLRPFPDDRLTVAYPGLPAHMFRRRNSPPRQPLIGILGRISETKGQREFLEAAAIVGARRADVRFRIIGTALFNDQKYADEIKAMPRQLGIADQVVFSGWTEDPVGELDSLTGLVHASPVAEPFGQVIVEAMARGVPVIATRGGGVTEILDPAGKAPTASAGVVVRTPHGQLVNTRDVEGLARAINWLIDQPSEAAEMAEHAFHSAKRRFAISGTAARVMSAWDNAGQKQ